MKRDYSSGTEENIELFVGYEIEHSPAHGMKTLFVVGECPSEDVLVLAKRHSVEHVYFGANMSFPIIAEDDAEVWTFWTEMILPVLKQDYFCTLDLDVACVSGLLETGLTEYDRFIPMISVKLPYVQQLGYNATIKLDDSGFRHSNPGIWCHSLTELLKRENFTAWSKYSKDILLK